MNKLPPDDIMQKTLVRKCHNGVNKARIVKIRSFTGTSTPSRCLYDPSVFSFRSLSLRSAYSPTSPVYSPLSPGRTYSPLSTAEEPSCAF